MSYHILSFERRIMRIVLFGFFGGVFFHDLMISAA